ncbi:MAG: hypothetical protein K0R49_1023 [Burkholderiales bacterium]|nr:hypothetical protein [Burkholderiales bacterium]MCE3268771.1 hypothetical protein [Burkholderiales bacterium]
MKKGNFVSYLCGVFLVLCISSSFAAIKGPQGNFNERIIDTSGAQYTAWWQVENKTGHSISLEFLMYGSGNPSSTVANMQPNSITNPIKGGYGEFTTNKWHFNHLVTSSPEGNYYTYGRQYDSDKCDVTKADVDASFDSPIRVIVWSYNQVQIVMGSKTCEITLPIKSTPN